MAETAQTYHPQIRRVLKKAGFQVITKKAAGKKTGKRRLEVTDPVDGTRWKLDVKTCA